ncbi:cellulose binding domain-containing protein [Nonomuraea sp. NPDC003201]
MAAAAAALRAAAGLLVAPNTQAAAGCRIDHSVTNQWNGTVSRSGAQVTVTNTAYNGTPCTGSTPTPTPTGSRAPPPRPRSSWTTPR